MIPLKRFLVVVEFCMHTKLFHLSFFFFHKIVLIICVHSIYEVSIAVALKSDLIVDQFESCNG